MKRIVFQADIVGNTKEGTRPTQTSTGIKHMLMPMRKISRGVGR
jgi:hypothetical protein